jgi:3-(3-hydroxy-phenyl)propionate hydroxylase
MTAPPPATTIESFAYRQDTPALPLLHGGRDRQQRRVAIRGGGPVGFALALGLARHRVPSVVLKADASVCTGSHAICASRRSL